VIIRALHADDVDDVDAVVEFAVRAWRPVFESFLEVMGPKHPGKPRPSHFPC
jgi:hypothetical protein